MPDQNDFIAIGKITKPVGIKGNLKVITLTDFPDRFNEIKKVYLFDEEEQVFRKSKLTGEFEFEIDSVKVQHAFVNLKLEGYSTKEEAGLLRNHLVMIRENERVILREGHYYFELIGCKVFDKGSYIGEVKSVVDHGSGDLLNVISDGHEILIPYLKEFVRKVDIAGKRIDVELIDGFLE